MVSRGKQESLVCNAREPRLLEHGLGNGEWQLRPLGSFGLQVIQLNAVQTIRIFLLFHEKRKLEVG